jgi:hypothetical protein
MASRRLLALLCLLLSACCCGARKPPPPAPPTSGTVAYYEAMTPDGREAYLRGECHRKTECPGAAPIIQAASGLSERAHLEHVRDELRQEAAGTPTATATATVAPPGGGSSGPRCNDGTPALCTGKGCCSRHGGVAR